MTENDDVVETQEQEEISIAQTVLALDLPLGDVLKNTRLEKGLELNEIAQTLCIRESFLEALEEGDYSSFPALVYGAGFLRSYASYLGLDGDQLTKKFHNETSHLKEVHAEPHTVEDKNVVPTKRFLNILLLAIVFIGGTTYFCANKGDEKVQEPAPAMLDAGALEAEEKENAVEKTLDTEAQKEPLSLVPTTSDELVKQVEVIEQKLIIEKAPLNLEVKPLDLKALVPVQKKDEPMVEEVANKVYGIQEGARLSIKATSKVWVEVKSGDKVVLNKVLNEGDTYNPPLEAEGYLLKTANAGALTVYLDGEMKKVLGRKGHVLKDVPLTIDAYED